MELSPLGLFVVVALIAFLIFDIVRQHRAIVKLRKMQELAEARPDMPLRKDSLRTSLSGEALARIEEFYQIVGFPVAGMRKRYPQNEDAILMLIEHYLAEGVTLRDAFVYTLNLYMKKMRVYHHRLHQQKIKGEWVDTSNIDAFIQALNISIGDEPVTGEQIEQHYHKAGRMFTEEIGL